MNKYFLSIVNNDNFIFLSYIFFLILGELIVFLICVY